MEEKRDKKAIGLALFTAPISVVGALSGSDIARANETGIIQDERVDAEKPDGTSATVSTASVKTAAASTPLLSTSSQLNYTVKPGDTISKIARKFQLSTNQLLELNKLTVNSIIVPGQSIKLLEHAVVPVSQAKADAATVHIVKPGDTLHGIARKFEIPVSTVLAINKLSKSAIIFPGQKLIIGSVIPKTTKPTTPDKHIAKAGESLASIANQYGIALETILKANGFTESSLLYGGQAVKLKIAAITVPESTKAAAKTEPSKKSTSASLSDEFITQDPRRPSTVCKTHGYHTVKTGESVGKVAAIYGLPTQKVLNTNGLKWSQTIYIGQKLIIPGVHSIKTCPEITKLTKEMKSNARAIYEVGKSLGVNDYGIVIALATAMQESRLRNINYGDRDSVGLFQQRPSSGWGKVSQIRDPEYAARAFFGGKTNPNRGTRGLLDIKDWDDLPLTKAAQAVQVSAYPNAYAKWEISAWVWLDQLIADAAENA